MRWNAHAVCQSERTRAAGVPHGCDGDRVGDAGAGRDIGGRWRPAGDAWRHLGLCRARHRLAADGRISDRAPPCRTLDLRRAPRFHARVGAARGRPRPLGARAAPGALLACRPLAADTVGEPAAHALGIGPPGPTRPPPQGLRPPSPPLPFAAGPGRTGSRRAPGSARPRSSSSSSASYR